MNTLLNFAFENGLVRVIPKEDGPRFVLTDVCRALEISNSRDMASRLDEDEKGVAIVDTLGGNQSTIVISEAGLYRLVFTSRKPIAEKFKRWLAHEVLPALRKTGSYSLPGTPKPEENLLAEISQWRERALADPAVRAGEGAHGAAALRQGAGAAGVGTARAAQGAGAGGAVAA